MIFTKRQFSAGFGTSLAVLWLLCAPLAAQAQQAKVLRILVGYAPGGAADTVARALGEGLRESGYTVIVENKAGAAGRLAPEAVVAAPADGNTLLLAPLNNLTVYPHIYKNLRYDPLKDLTPVGSVSEMSFAFAVGASSPAKTLQEYVALAQKDRSLASYGTPGAGTPMHFLGVMLGRATNLPLTHIPYKGGSAAVADVIGGSLPSLITTTPNLLQMHKAGKLRILGTSDAAPNPALPNVPTFQSLGYGELTMSEVFGVFARSGTPAPVVTQLNEAISRSVKSPKVFALLEKSEFTVRTMTPDALAKQLRAEHASWAKVVKDTGYTVED